MHLFNINRLAGKLRANALSETEKYHYLLATVALQAISVTSRVATAQTSVHFAEVIVATVISLAGLYFCYKVNQRGDDQRLIERVICLSVPVIFWVYLTYLLCFYGGFLSLQIILGRPEALSIWRSLHAYSLLVSSVLLLAHYGLLNYFIDQVSRPQAATPPAPLAAP